uniref:Si:dkeyp-69b9.3 n=1 Tax=Nothobranchius furzeri TaxID=105023 RepID=A0A8C6NWZ8_NOTFU
APEGPRRGYSVSMLCVCRQLGLPAPPVSELRQQLRKRGLPVSGTKPALLQRLRPFQLPHACPAPAPISDPSCSLLQPNQSPGSSSSSGQDSPCGSPNQQLYLPLQITASPVQTSPGIRSLEEELQEAIQKAQVSLQPAGNKQEVLLRNNSIDDILNEPITSEGESRTIFHLQQAVGVPGSTRRRGQVSLQPSR